MTQLARELKEKGNDVISLSIGEPDFTTPSFIKDAAKKALDDGFTYYTPVAGLAELRKAIVEKLKRDNGLEYSIGNILVSNGAKQSIYNLCRALINPGDEVIVFAPYWVSYVEMIRLCGGVPIELKATVERDYKVSAQQVKQAITKKTKFVLFSSPCNPTGSVYNANELTEIANVIAPHEDIIVVSDEIYEYIVFDGVHSSIAQNSDIFARTVVVNGMSKGFAMTGWRLGYIAGPKDIVDACTKIQGQVTSGASSFGQMAAAAALQSDLSEVKLMTETFKKRRDLVIGELKKISGLKLSIPDGAFYVFPDCSYFFGKSYDHHVIENADVLAELILEKAHVATVSGAAFGAENCIRLSYAASDEVLLKACQRLQAFFGAIK